MDSLAGRESGEPQRFREQAQREIDALNDAFNNKIADLEQVRIFRDSFSDTSYVSHVQFLIYFKISKINETNSLLIKVIISNVQESKHSPFVRQFILLIFN